MRWGQGHSKRGSAAIRQETDTRGWQRGPALTLNHAPAGDNWDAIKELGEELSEVTA